MSATLWECDGCGGVTAQESVAEAVHEECPKHWGWMEVGGPAWMQFHVEGVHPMQKMAQDVLDAYARVIVEDLLHPHVEEQPHQAESEGEGHEGESTGDTQREPDF